MIQIKIIADGNTKKQRDNARGKLFEKLMADVLRTLGYKIDDIPNVNYAGMEIDINGKAIATEIPLYAECKCYETPVNSEKFQSFFGKYMSRWLKNHKCNGLFIALPGINSHAKGFYEENCLEHSEFTLRLLQMKDVIDIVLDSQLIIRPEEFQKRLTPDIGISGDIILLYTDIGLYWLQYIIPSGGGIASRVLFVDNIGNFITDSKTLELLVKLYPEINDFEKVVINREKDVLITRHEYIEEIIEVRGSSECFEYQFPASPEFFIGRKNILEEIEKFVEKIRTGNTSSRGILFEANSGFGKSSIVLASVNRISELDHFALAIDSRTATSSQFILRVIDYTLNKFKSINLNTNKNKTANLITGFDGAVDLLINVGNELLKQNKILFIFLDQFENIFFQKDLLKKISHLLLKLSDARTNVILGFSWKTDFIGLTSEFPYELRDSISGSSYRIQLDTFSEQETNELLDRLSTEINAPLRKDLRFLLSEFSQGYPWLLKKLCAHVKLQREAGIAQAVMANSLLNVNELFHEDLKGLSPDQEYALRKIAKEAPVLISDISEELNHDIIQSLVNRRLIVRVGAKFDIYWDIFRDYLNTGKLPVQENFILRVGVGASLKAANILLKHGPRLTSKNFREQLGVSEKTYFNIIRDLRLLNIVKVDGNYVKLPSKKSFETNEYEEMLSNKLAERLPRNRIVWQILKKLETSISITIDDLAKFISGLCPYISASEQTWRTYAIIFAD